MEECNVDNDIDTFVSERKTGSDRPAPLRYVNYYHPTQVSPEPYANKPTGIAVPIREPPNKALPPIPTDGSSVVMNDPGDDGVCVYISLCGLLLSSFHCRCLF